MSANFRNDGKVDKLIDLFILPNIKGEKKFTFCLKIFVGILDEWDALFVSFFMSVRDTVKYIGHHYWKQIYL